eukprot:13229001-Heterocapsa_arctica.AAC.1
MLPLAEESAGVLVDLQEPFGLGDRLPATRGSRAITVVKRDEIHVHADLVHLKDLLLDHAAVLLDLFRLLLHDVLQQIEVASEGDSDQSGIVRESGHPYGGGSDHQTLRYQ